MRKQRTLGAIARLPRPWPPVAGWPGPSSGATVPGTEPAGTTGGSAAPAGDAVTFESGLDFNSILLPKFTGIAVFDQANEGAQEAAAELGTQPTPSSSDRPPTTASPARSSS